MDILAQIKESEVSDDGSFQEGFLYGSVKNIGEKTAQVNGVSLLPGEAKSYPFVGKGYHKINYESKGSTLRVLEVL